MPLRVAGPTGSFTTVSALDILSGDADIELDGRVVIIGVTASGLGDRFATPFDRNMPGVEVIATAVEQLLWSDGLWRNPQVRQIEALVALPVAVLCVLLTLLLPLSRGLPLAVAIMIGWVAVTWFVFPGGLWLSSAVPLVCAGLPILPAALLRYSGERRRAALSERAVSAFKKFQSPEIADMIGRNPDFLLHPEERKMVVCFVDLSGFTRISQDLGPARSQAFLKQFHRLLSDTVKPFDGVVLNFMGDGALIVFGAFESSDTVADNALNCAIRLVRDTRGLGVAEGLAHPLRSRIGLHFGDVVLSRLGDDSHQQLSVSGDTVNLCSRLLEVAKEGAENIAATNDFIASLSQPLPAPVDRQDTVLVRGREGAVAIGFWRV